MDQMKTKADRLCFGCMREMNPGDTFCRYCGFHYERYMANRVPYSLKPGGIIQDRYILGKVLGTGGFGITYIGYDTKLCIRVAIKEYFPYGMAKRINPGDTEESQTVIIENKPERYKEELNRFLEEARTLASFNQMEGIVTVLDFFYANNTGYYVMDYLPGTTVKQQMKGQNAPFTQEETLTLLRPVIRSLKKVHRKGIIHRDISPDNLVMNENGMPVLIDFGAAKRLDNTSDGAKILKHGYSALEQYDTRGEQGPWTDVYALCATIYNMVTMRTLPKALDRLRGAGRVPLDPMYYPVTREFADAVNTGLEPDRRNRFQSMEALENALYSVEKTEDDNSGKMKPVLIGIGSILALLIVAAVIVLGNMLIGPKKKAADNSTKAAVSETVAETSEATTTQEDTQTDDASAALGESEPADRKVQVEGVYDSAYPVYDDYRYADQFRLISFQNVNGSFGYPTDFFSEVTKTDEDFYTFTTSDGSATLEVGPVYEDDQEGYLNSQCNYYLSVLDFDDNLHSGTKIMPDHEQGFMHGVLGGSIKGDPSRGIYFIGAIKDGQLYTMKFTYVIQDDREVCPQNYVIECLYQTCSFSGTTHGIRDYDEYERMLGDWP